MAAEQLPSSIVALLEQVTEGLAQWARTHRQASLAEHEQGVLAIFRQALGPMLAAVLGEALDLEAPWRRRLRAACPGCGGRQRVHSFRPRQVLTVCGPIRLRRPYYRCPSCRHGWSPADATLELAAYQALSRGLQQWLAVLGGQLPFRQAAALLELLTGLGVGAETVRSQAEAAGAALGAAQQAAAGQVLATQEAAEPLDPAPGVLLVEVDGLMGRYLDGWHEIKLALVGGCQPGAPPGGEHALLAPSYVAARASAEAFGPLLLAEAARRGALEVQAWEQPPGTDGRLALGPHLAVLRPVVVLGDGAPWIWHLAAEYFGERTEIVDWYHASEHLWALGRALFGDGTAQTRAWVQAALDLLWEQGPEPLLARLAAIQPPSAEAAETLRRERGYFTTNAPRMQYPAFRARGLPVGSGAVESAAKHVVQQRMKRAGMRWSTRGGQAILVLCTTLASHRPLLKAA